MKELANKNHSWHDMTREVDICSDMKTLCATLNKKASLTIIFIFVIKEKKSFNT